MGLVAALVGAGVPSTDRISLLREAEGDGVAETRTVFLESLHSPFGIALIGNTIYVANTDAVVTFAVNERDKIGSDLVPYYMTSVRDGDFMADAAAPMTSMSANGPSPRPIWWQPPSCRITHWARMPDRLA